MDIPPVESMQHEPVMIAQVSSAQPAHTKIDRVIGVCKLIQNQPVPVYTAVNAVDVLGAVNIYLKIFEHNDNWLSGTVNLMQEPKYGSLEMDEHGGRFHPVPDYYGRDNATFLVNVDGLVIKAEYSFKIQQGAPGGTEGYDPYEDKENCPNGAYWKISNTSDER